MIAKFVPRKKLKGRLEIKRLEKYILKSAAPEHQCLRNLFDFDTAVTDMEILARRTSSQIDPFMHVVLSFHSVDEDIVRKKFERIGGRILELVGLKDAQAILTLHCNTAHHHIHVAVSRVIEVDAGMCIKTRFWNPHFYNRLLQRAAAQVELEFGLRKDRRSFESANINGTIVVIRKSINRDHLTEGKGKKGRRLGDLGREVGELELGKVKNWGEFYKILNDAGLRIVPIERGRYLVARRRNGGRPEFVPFSSCGTTIKKIEAKLGTFAWPSDDEIIELRALSRFAQSQECARERHSKSGKHDSDLHSSDFRGMSTKSLQENTSPIVIDWERVRAVDIRNLLVHLGWQRSDHRAQIFSKRVHFQSENGENTFDLSVLVERMESGRWAYSVIDGADEFEKKFGDAIDFVKREVGCAADEAVRFICEFLETHNDGSVEVVGRHAVHLELSSSQRPKQQVTSPVSDSPPSAPGSHLKNPGAAQSTSRIFKTPPPRADATPAAPERRPEARAIQPNDPKLSQAVPQPPVSPVVGSPVALIKPAVVSAPALNSSPPAKSQSRAPAAQEPKPDKGSPAANISPAAAQRQQNARAPTPSKQSPSKAPVSPVIASPAAPIKPTAIPAPVSHSSPLPKSPPRAPVAQASNHEEATSVANAPQNTTEGLPRPQMRDPKEQAPRPAASPLSSAVAPVSARPEQQKADAAFLMSHSQDRSGMKNPKSQDSASEDASSESKAEEKAELDRKDRNNIVARNVYFQRGGR